MLPPAPLAPTAARRQAPPATVPAASVAASAPPERPRGGGPRRAAAARLAPGIAVLAVALALRLWGLAWGAPFDYHPDEHLIITGAAHMAATGDLDPHFFHYPSLLFDVEAAAMRALHAVAGWPLPPAGPSEDAGLGDVVPALFPYAVAGRALVAVVGALACLAVAAALRVLGAGRLPALLGGLALAVAPLAVEDAHYLTTDVPSLAACALTLWASALLLRRGNAGAALLAGAGAGLAASAKYNAGLIVLVPALVLCLAPLAGRRRRAAALLLLGAAYAFALTSPFVLLDPRHAAYDIAQEALHYRSGHLGADSAGGPSWSWYAAILLNRAWGPPLSLAAALGLAAGLRRHARMLLPLLAFAAAYLAAIGSATVHFDRNLLPLFPALALAAGLAAEAVARWSVARRPMRRPPPALALLPLLGALALLPAAVADVGQDRLLGRDDTRTLALGRLTATLPADAAVVRESFTPQLEWTHPHLLEVGTLGDHPLAWYRRQGYQYAVVSSWQDDPVLAEPGRAPAAAAAYRQLFAQPPLLEVPAAPDRPGPTIRVYRLPDGG